jgi:hypothetical protein
MSGVRLWSRRECQAAVPWSDSLVIMARKVVEVRACDRCGKEPAHTWTITGPEGAAREIDLCDHHSAPVANAYALARASKRPGRRSAAHPAARRPADLALPRPPPEPVWR